MAKLTRRTAITLLAGGGAVAAGAAGTGYVMSSEGDLVRSILRRGVGEFRMADADFRAFVADLGTDQKWSTRARNAVFRVASEAGPDGLPMAPEKVAERYEVYQRKVVTNFLTRTDYLRVDPAKEGVAFVGGDRACSSPFANFDLA